jgi:hypothetical protein
MLILPNTFEDSRLPSAIFLLVGMFQRFAQNSFENPGNFPTSKKKLVKLKSKR